MFAAHHGAATAAGLANGGLLGATVAAELATPRLVARIGHRCALGAGLLLLGAPTLVLLTPWGSSVPAMLAVNAIRGVGFAISVVSGGALTAALIPHERRGEGLALVGLVGGVPALVSLPFGAWAARHWGYDLIFILTAVVPLLAILSIPGLPRRDMLSGGVDGFISTTLRNRRVTSPAAHLPDVGLRGGCRGHLPADRGGSTRVLGRTGRPAGAAHDIHGGPSPWRVGSGTGSVRPACWFPGSPWRWSAWWPCPSRDQAVSSSPEQRSSAPGFGVLQNATLTLMYARVTSGEYSPVSAIWNGAYDLGMGCGAVVVGALAAPMGYSGAFLAIAATMLPALVIARREARSGAAPALGVTTTTPTPTSLTTQGA